MVNNWNSSKMHGAVGKMVSMAGNSIIVAVQSTICNPVDHGIKYWSINDSRTFVRSCSIPHSCSYHKNRTNTDCNILLISLRRSHTPPRIAHTCTRNKLHACHSYKCIYSPINLSTSLMFRYLKLMPSICIHRQEPATATQYTDNVCQ